MSDFLESEAEESEEEYDEDGAVAPRVTKKFVEEEDGEPAFFSSFAHAWMCHAQQSTRESERSLANLWQQKTTQSPVALCTANRWIVAEACLDWYQLCPKCGALLCALAEAR